MEHLQLTILEKQQQEAIKYLQELNLDQINKISGLQSENFEQDQNIQRLKDQVSAQLSEIITLSQNVTILQQKLNSTNVLALEAEIRQLKHNWKQRVPFPDVIGNFTPVKQI